MDILLVNPQSALLPGVNATTAQRRTHINFGLCCLASALEKNNYRVGIVDAFAFSLKNKDILNVIFIHKPKIIGISTYTVSLREVYDLICDIKKEIPFDSEIIVGGFHPTLEPYILPDLNVKYGLMGDAEYSIVLLCNYLLKNEGEKENIPGLISVSENKISINPQDRIENLDNLPTPSYNLFFDKKGRRFPPNFRWEVVNLTSSRGCKYKCKFCSTTGFRPKVSYRNPEIVVEDIKKMEKLYNLGIIFFSDETFGADWEHTQKLCKLIKDKKIKTEWACFTRVDCLDEEIIKEMKSANCAGVFLGIEAGSESVRKFIDKPSSDLRCKEIIAICKKYNITCGVHFILGIPGETKEDIEKTIKFSEFIEPDAAYYKFYVPVPGSFVYDEMLKNRIIQKDLWIKYMKGENDFPIIPPPGLSKKDLIKIEVFAFKKFYFNIKRLPRLFFKFGFSYIISLLWLILKEGIKSKTRKSDLY